MRKRYRTRVGGHFKVTRKPILKRPIPPARRKELIPLDLYPAVEKAELDPAWAPEPDIWQYPLSVNDMAMAWYALARGQYPRSLGEFTDALKRTLKDGGAQADNNGHRTVTRDWNVDAIRARRRTYAAKLLLAIDQYQQLGDRPGESFGKRLYPNRGTRPAGDG